MVKQTRVIPDYDGGSIVNLMASIARGLDADGGRYDSLRLLPQQRISQYRQVALIVVDGLGFDFLHEHAELAPTLAACASGSMTSVFPSTTAAAIGTYLTGVAPIEHGLTGWYMYLRELAAVLAVLPGFGRCGAPLYNDRVDVGELLGTTPFAARLGVDTVMVAPRSIAGSPFNRSHQGGSTLYPYDTLEQLFMYTAAALAEPGRRYIYSYWPDLDHTGHKRGMGSKATLDLMRTLEAQFCAFLESIRGTQTLVLLTADHGHINTSAERTFTLNDFPEVQQHLRLPLCGEPRAAYAYLRPGAEEPFLRALQDTFGDEVVARPSCDVLAEGWFGPGPAHPELLNRIGDYVLLPQSNQMVRDWLPLERRFPLHSAHGGLSQAEMLVPLVIAESD
jgi:predicted AlkP superfamily pyrophosphatase or phosphodiesterase